MKVEAMAKKSKKNGKRLMETAIALEIAKFQRDSLKAQVEQLKVQLNAAAVRAERAEDRLHETTVMLSKLSLQATSHAVKSTIQEVLVEGRTILRLMDPINSPPTIGGARQK